MSSGKHCNLIIQKKNSQSYAPWQHTDVFHLSHMETSSLLVKGCKFWLTLSAQTNEQCGFWPVTYVHTCPQAFGSGTVTCFNNLCLSQPRLEPWPPACKEHFLPLKQFYKINHAKIIPLAQLYMISSNPHIFPLCWIHAAYIPLLLPLMLQQP